MAREGLIRRLAEIDMDPLDASVYEEYYGNSDAQNSCLTILGNVKNQIEQFRVIIESLEASKSDARSWSRHQTSGDLDESKLVEGVTGRVRGVS